MHVWRLRKGRLAHSQKWGWELLGVPISFSLESLGNFTCTLTLCQFWASPWDFTVDLAVCLYCWPGCALWEKEEIQRALDWKPDGCTISAWSLNSCVTFRQLSWPPSHPHPLPNSVFLTCLSPSLRGRKWEVGRKKLCRLESLSKHRWGWCSFESYKTLS